MPKPVKCTSWSQPIPMPGAACGPSPTWLLIASASYIAIFLSLATLLLRHLPSSAMSHSIYGLPAPMTWVIRIYVLIGVNTKMGVTAINSQALLRKILSRAVLSPAWQGRVVPLQPVCPSLGQCPDPSSHVSGPCGQGWRRLSWEVGTWRQAEV